MMSKQLINYEYEIKPLLQKKFFWNIDKDNFKFYIENYNNSDDKEYIINISLFNEMVEIITFCIKISKNNLKIFKTNMIDIDSNEYCNEFEYLGYNKFKKAIISYDMEADILSINMNIDGIIKQKFDYNLEIYELTNKKLKLIEKKENKKRCITFGEMFDFIRRD